MHRPDNDL
jgi:hypothetical protein